MATLAAIGGLLGVAGKVLPTVLPLISKGVDFASDWMSKRKKSNLIEESEKNKEIINFQNTILPTPDRGSGNFRYMPRFNDEESYTESRIPGNFSISRDQFDSTAENFDGYRNRRGDARSIMNNYNENFRRPVNQGFKRAYNVYADNSLGGGYGGNSSLTQANEMSVNRSTMGYDSNSRVRIPRSFDADDDYAPSRKFLRRMPEDRSSRYGSSSVANLNFDTRAISNLLGD